MKEIRELTGLRFVAALYVFLFHLQLRGMLPDMGWRINNIISQGALGVNIFFILSGVVLSLGLSTKSYHSISIRQFMFKRMSKLAPVYWAGMLVSVVVVYAMRSMPPDLSLLVFLNSLFLNAWIPSKAMAWYGSGSWSLCAEMFFYLCFCIILPRIIKMPANSLALLLLIVCVISAIPGLIHWLYPSLGLFNWVYSFPPARIAEFISGMIIALLVFRHQWKVPIWATMASITILLVYMAYAGKRMDGWVAHNWVVTPLLCVFIAGLTQPSRLFGWLRSDLLVFLGRISYSFYIWQIVIMIAIEIVQEHHVLLSYSKWVLVSVTLALNLLLAYFSYLLIENPAHKWLNNKYVFREQ